MRATDVIMKKRGSILNPSGSELTREEIEFIVKGYVDGSIPDYQISAWLMAVYFNGMTFEETARLTDIMLHSGDVMDLSSLSGPFVDKHSTGGVGDKISLPLAPIVAACGIQVPMMSGRALGHTGGTLDKLESIEGYRVGLSQEEFCSIIGKCGYAMTGQTKEIVPADRLLYALRDVTGTVESVPLITASILSKKVAEGSDALVFDVKWGTGAFMKTRETAFTLADSLVKTAQAMGKKAAALITDMNTPLGEKTGNFLEIEETVDILKGLGPEDVRQLTYALAAQMLVLGGKAKDKAEGTALAEEAVKSGRALDLFLKNVDIQGGDSEKLLSQFGKRRSQYKKVIVADKDGYMSIDAYKSGIAGISLGVGRNRTEDSVCPDAGFILLKKQGDKVCKGDEIMEVFGKDEACFDDALPILRSAIEYSETEPEKNPLIYKEIC
ncbi:MAG: thymidine phosphorylase [Treponemataceae bacterium]|nr:thymidine phosphorylase [Treponemataceae bacterium]